MRPIYIIVYVLLLLPFASTAKRVKARPTFVGDCATSTSQIDLNINNVRARLLGGGDMWWNGTNKGRYIVPKAFGGAPEVSAIFSGGLWLGAKDQVGNIKLAAQTYRYYGRDFWPGPIDEGSSTTDKTTCKNWDRHFVVYGKEIDSFLIAFRAAELNGIPLKLSEIPDNIKYWPAKGNPYFEEKYKFPLPTTKQSLAPFFDHDGDDNYDPMLGDYPIINEKYHFESPAELIFWITNDVGNKHSSSPNTEPMGLEIQNVAFSFLSEDPTINNTTFYGHQLINRSTTLLRDFYAGIWLDPGLGCGTDDFIGCEIARNLMYIYNADDTDGDANCKCGTTPTYCKNIPMVGVQILSGGQVLQYDTMSGNPIDTINGGMSYFTYYSNESTAPTFMQAPTLAQSYYNYLTARWGDGRRFTGGGLSYDVASTNYTNFVFTDAPDNMQGWTMDNVFSQGQDIRTIQSMGPLKMLPGQSQNILYSVLFTPNIKHPRPSLNAMKDAADRVKWLFDNAFRPLCFYEEGPDAPTLLSNSKSQAIELSFDNDLNSNNQGLQYEQGAVLAPVESSDPNYRFEGYRVFQLKDNVLINNDSFFLNKTDQAREVYQCDLNNTVKDVFYYTPNLAPNGQPTSWNKLPYVKAAKNKGIPQSFTLTTDAFTGEPLENGKTYYYTAVAYAYNNYTDFNTVENYGQRKQYLQGRRNVKVYAVTPQKSVGSPLETTVVRLEGQGTGPNILQIAPNMRDSIFKGTNQGRVTYAASSSPVQIVVIEPAKCKNKQFHLTLIDKNLSDTIIDAAAKWKLTEIASPINVEVISERSISEFNNQLLKQYGFFLKMDQVAEPGTKAGSSQNNGFRSAKLTYNAIPFNWYEAIGDGYVNTKSGKINQPFLNWHDTNMNTQLDPFFYFSKDQQQFYPFGLMDFWGRVQNNILDPYLTAGYLLETTFGPISRSPLERLNNVDIVLTPDKSKWSRCVVVETANAFYTNKYNPNNPATENYLGLETKANPLGKFPLQFDLRGDLSVGKNDSDEDGRPDPDNAQDAAGAPLYGMGWFPGYAVDIETGKRLNIFFGENSCYSKKHHFYCPKENQIGGDMLWNPNGNLYVTPDFSVNRTYKYFAGGQQYIYVTNQNYDACETMRKALLTGNKSVKATQLRTITWVSMPMPTKPLKPLGAGNKGLIPSEMLVRIRVDNAYQWKSEKGLNNGYPTYYLSFGSRAISDQNPDFELFGLRAKRRPDLVAFPNPVQTGDGLQLQNLPEAAEVEIYELTGKLLVKQAASFQYVWNLQGTNGKTVTPGVYVVKVLNLQTEQYEAIKVIVH